MRHVINRAVEAMELPSAVARADALSHAGDGAFNAAAQAEWPCFTTLELRQPGQPLPPPHTLTIAAWNIERCKRVDDSAALLRALGADVVLATEMDHGMARSGQRHTTRDLADALGMGYAFGTEFVELGTGDPFETKLFKDVPNDHGLHGNAILSRYPLHSPTIVPLDEGGLWFVSQPKGDGQYRLGGRMAVGASIRTASGTLTLAAVHYESESDQHGRAKQTKVMLDTLAKTYGDGPAVIGGDLNTNNLLDGERAVASAMHNPATMEPSFNVFAEHGFRWESANAGVPTTRTAPGREAKYPLALLDWLFVRDVAPMSPKVQPAISEAGQYLSDHECICVRVNLQGAAA